MRRKCRVISWTLKIGNRPLLTRLGDMKHWPFKVLAKDGKPNIQVSVKGVDKVFSPEEVSAMVLVKMKEIAEAYLGEAVTHAGI